MFYRSGSVLFNSYVFVFFLILVYSAYLLLSRRYNAQNLLLLIASYIFYAFWDWRFISLIATSTLIDFWVGRWIYSVKKPQHQKLLLALSIASNLSILGFFKYFNFFSESLIRLFSLVGFEADSLTLRIILPVGISFYTFQSMSYTFDVFRRKIQPTSKFLDFALYVSFFPQLVAGPIERASNLLPQFTSARKLTIAQVHAGLFLILWGYFKKVVIADNVGMIADQVFNGYTQYQGVDTVIGALAFTVQIYCDFSGYSDIARGVAKLMGFDLMLNFRLPYFALNPSDFWSRWHVSLSTWLRDYLYVPLGGNRKGSLNTYRNLGLTMLLGGLWHGAAWNFVIWGAYHGLLLIIYRLAEGKIRYPGRLMGRYRYALIPSQMLIMFGFTVIGWVIFRSTSVDQILYMLTNMGPRISGDSLDLAYRLAFFSLPLVAIQFYQHTTRDLLILTKLKVWIRVPIYSFFLTWIFIFGVRESTEFIYFQF